MTTVFPELSERGSEALIARVILDTPLPQLDQLFDYRVPEYLRNEIKPGQRVKVPFRSRLRGVLGYVVQLSDKTEFAGNLAELTEIVSPVQVLQPEVWNLVRELAERSAGSVNDVLRLAIPPRQVRVENKYLENLQLEETREPAAKQTADAHPVEDSFVTETARLLSQGENLFVDVRAPVLRLSTGQWVGAGMRFFAGVAKEVFETKKSVILVVPDFRDLEQLEATLKSLGINDYVRFDAGQPMAKRYRNFLQTLGDDPRIIIGNRAAIYAPAKNLGAILVWDEADRSLKEQLAPYVHARDTALIRAAQGKTGLLFSSNSRSTQMQRLIDMGYLKQSHLGSFRPRIIRSEAVQGRAPWNERIPEFAIKVMRDALKTGPVLVQVANAGMAPALACTRCEETATCKNCSGQLALKSNNTVFCRVCGDPNKNWSCRECGELTMKPRGVGSVMTADQFEKMFRGFEIILSDGEHRRLQVDAAPAIVVATRGAEPVAIGGYKAVILLDVVKLLMSPHLRAGEDALRWWRGAIALGASDVVCVLAGGSGNIVESLSSPYDEAWLRSELQDRSFLRFPPAVRVATVSGIKHLVEKALASVQGVTGVDVLGPAYFQDETRATVRFDYRSGKEVATVLRAELLESIADEAAKKYARQKAGRSAGKKTVSLRLKFDDESAFDERNEN